MALSRRTPAQASRAISRAARTASCLWIALAAAALPVRASPEPHAQPAYRVPERGVALGLFASDPAWDYGPLVDEIARTGATDIQLDVVWLQTDVRSVDIAPAPGTSPDDATLERTIAQAHARGLRVTLFPIVRPAHTAPGEWRGTFAPAAGVERWFAAYRTFLERMAALAARARVARLSVGSELCSLEEHEAQWRMLIADVRRTFTGELMYSANWDQLDRVRFWDVLDVAGTTAYFELGRVGEQPDLATLRARWQRPLETLRAFARRAGKPVVITEVGYPSHAEAARAPWDETRAAPRDLALQARLVRAACDTLARADFLAGVTWWNWFGFGGVDDTGYTPRDKPAARELTRCYAR